MRRRIVKSPYVSALLRIVLGLLALTLVILVFYIYHEEIHNWVKKLK